MMTTVKCIKQAGLALIGISLSLAAPGDLDGTFAPVQKRQIFPQSVIVTAGEKILLGKGGFDHADGISVGDWVLLGTDGEVEGEPVPGFLDNETFDTFPLDGSVNRDWFPLEEGKWLIPHETSGWLRIDGPGLAPLPAFTDLPAGQSVKPQFLRAGKLWLIRTGADGRRTLEVRNSADGSVDPAFVHAADRRQQPSQAVPAADGGAWVLGGDRVPAWLGFGAPAKPDNQVTRVTATGALDTAIPAKIFSYYEAPELRAGPDGSLRVTCGRDRRWDQYWPSPTMDRQRIEWFDAQGVSEKVATFWPSIYSIFVWAETADGKVLANDNDRILRRYLPDGSVDESFISPGRVASLRSLSGGKWLVDGTRRLLPDGQADPSWQVPSLEAQGQVEEFHALGDGRMLIVGAISKVQGAARAGLAVLNADGSLDGSFTPDPRIGMARSAVISGGAIYVVTAEKVMWTDGRIGKLVKLDFSGNWDESFGPQLSGLSDPGRVFPQIGGKIVASGYEMGGDVTDYRVVEMDATGAVLRSFHNPTGGPLVLANGEIVMGGEFHQADGQIRRVGGAERLMPVCEWQAGVLFTEEVSSPAVPLYRLRLWRDGRWVAGFGAEPILQWPVQAVAGGGGTLLLRAKWKTGGEKLRRMLPDGRLDEAFVMPVTTGMVRREAGAWKTSEPAGLTDFDPASTERELPVTAWIHHPETAALWIGGSFNCVNGENRDGLARLEMGATSAPETPPLNAYTAWALGMELTESGPWGDPDGDGVSNVMEFIFGSNPHTPSEGATATIDEDNAIFTYPLGAEGKDSKPVIEFSEDLAEWTNAEESEALVSSEPIIGDVLKVTVKLPRKDRQKLFFRLRTMVP